MYEKDEYSIANTTREQREKIVADSLGAIDATCDGCTLGILDMYQPYIDGKMELKECTMAFNARYIKDMDMEERRSCVM